MKAIFLDRDGVIVNNSQHYYIYKKEDVEFVDGIFENLISLKDAGYEFFIITNQGGIAKKLYTMDDVNKVHRHIANELEKSGIKIRDIMVCPHHESVEKCLCRKPSPLMVEKLIALYPIDPRQSFLIGDSDTDILAAKAAGVEGIKIAGNKNMCPFINEILKT